jgi:hypothetical protein
VRNRFLRLWLCTQKILIQELIPQLREEDPIARALPGYVRSYRLILAWTYEGAALCNL